MKNKGLITVLILVNLLIGVVNIWVLPKAETIFVLTPMIDVLPMELPLTNSEKDKLKQNLGFQPESRGLEEAYGYMGATLSFHDLLRGIQFLETSEVPLSKWQRESIQSKLKTMQADHHRLQQIQKELIGKEKELSRILKQLPYRSKEKDFPNTQRSLK